MAVRKIKLSDTQARVVGWSVLMGDTYTAYSVGRASRATFRKLFDLGLIDQPWAGSRLTLEGVNIRTSLQMDILQRTFFVSDVVSREAFVIQPVKEESTDDAGFCETGSETDIELSRASVYNTPRLFTGEPMNADSRRAEGVQRIVDKVNSRKGFPTATEQDTESTFFGGGGLTYSWWRIGKECRYQENGYDAVNGWEWEIKIEDPRAQFEWITVKLNHALILKAVRAISRLKLSRDSDAALKANKYMGDHVIQECRTWVFKGPDACDFDAGMADAVLQWATIGEVAYG